MPYVVVLDRDYRRDWQSNIEEYLFAIRRDPYRFDAKYETTPTLSGAFIFESLSAAEMAAVFVGGKVKFIERSDL